MMFFKECVVLSNFYHLKGLLLLHLVGVIQYFVLWLVTKRISMVLEK